MLHYINFNKVKLLEGPAVAVEPSGGGEVPVTEPVTPEPVAVEPAPATVEPAPAIAPEPVSVQPEPAATPGAEHKPPQPTYDPQFLNVLQNLIPPQPAEVVAPAQPVQNTSFLGGLSPDQLEELRDTNPDYVSRLERESLEQSITASLSQKFDSQLKEQAADMQAEQFLGTTYPDYSNPASQFRADFNALIGQVKDKSALVKLSVAALVNQMTQSPKNTQAAIAAAKVSGAVDEHARVAAANNAVVTGSQPVQSTTDGPDAQFIALSKSAGVDPAKAWARHQAKKTLIDDQVAEYIH